MKSNKLTEVPARGLPEPLPAADCAPAVYAFEEAPRGEDAERLRDFLRALRRRLWLVALVTALSTALVAVYMARQPDLYEAEAQVQVDLETINTAVAASKSGALAVNPVNDPAYFNTQLQILGRPRLLRRVVRTLDLPNDRDFRPAQAGVSNAWWRPLAGTKAEAASPATEARAAAAATGDAAAAGDTAAREDLAEAERLAPYVEAIQAGLKVEPVKEIRLPIKETRLINVTYRHEDPRVASRVVNAVADAFVLQNLERKTEANDSTDRILQERIAELQAQIRSRESQLLEYAKNHQILSLDPTQNTVVERLVGLNRQLLEAENERKLAEAAYNAALAPGAADALADGAARESAEAERKLADLRQRRAQLLVETTEEWPEVKEVDNQIAVLERQLKETRERASSVVLTNLGTRFRQTAAREQALRASFDRQRGETLTQNEAAINYRIIQQEIETNKRLLDGMLQRNKENEAIFAGMRNNIHVNDYAVTPQEPVGPRRLLNTAVAFALSLGFGVGLAVFLGYMDDSVRSTDDVRRALSLPTLASIPAVGTTRRMRLHAPGGRHNGNGNGHGNGNGNGNGQGRGNGHASPELLLSSAAPPPLTEACRQLRTSMLLSPWPGELKSLLVTSSAPGEGKTTTAVNTAVSLSRTGALVLLIDADLRKPRLHNVFHLPNESGLSTILADEVEASDALRSVVHDDHSGIDVLTSGPTQPESAELLASEQMQQLVAAFRSVYDYVVIDSPPLAYFSDGAMISSLVDGVVLVASSGSSSRELLRQSCQLLQGAGANICGVVLNNVKGSGYDYRQYYERA